MFQAKVVEQIKIHIYIYNVFSENRAVYEIMWIKDVEPCRPQIKDGACAFECWIPKTPNTPSVCVTIKQAN
jgi:hypothetical protein